MLANDGKSLALLMGSEVVRADWFGFVRCPVIALGIGRFNF